MKNLLVKLTFITILLNSSILLAQDSTDSPINNLTQTQSFSSSSNATKYYIGSTTGRINVSTGKSLTVNGVTHHRGFGTTTRIPVTKKVKINRCSDSTGKYNSCSYYQDTVVTRCDIIITDSYVIGCKNTYANSQFSCSKSRSGGDDYTHTCYSRYAKPVGAEGAIRSIIVEN